MKLCFGCCYSTLNIYIYIYMQIVKKQLERKKKLNYEIITHSDNDKLKSSGNTQAETKTKQKKNEIKKSERLIKLNSQNKTNNVWLWLIHSNIFGFLFHFFLFSNIIM